MLQRRSPSGPNITLPSYPARSLSPESGSATTIDWSIGPVQRLTLTNTCTVHALEGLPPGESATGLFLEITQGAGGSHSIDLEGVKTPTGNPIALSSTVGSKDLLEFAWDGFILFAWRVGLDFGP